MTETIQIGEVSIQVSRKAIKHVHLSVHPPNGRVTLVAPTATRLEVARAYAISKLGWIREQQTRLRNKPAKRRGNSSSGKAITFGGGRHLLTVIQRETKPSVTLDHKRLTLTMRPGSPQAKRAEIIHEWHKSLLHAQVPALIKSGNRSWA